MILRNCQYWPKFLVPYEKIRVFEKGSRILIRNISCKEKVGYFGDSNWSMNFMIIGKVRSSKKYFIGFAREMVI